MAENTDTLNHEELLAKARTEFAEDQEAEQRLRDETKIDLKFAAGDQWDPEIRRKREAAGRPALSFPRCHTFVQQVANEARQRRGEIKFVASDTGDKDTPEVLEGLARHIQYNSEARVAYETAVEYSAAGGFGYFRFLTDYCCDDPECDDLELKVMPVVDPLSVYGALIPACFGIEPDHAFVMGEPICKDEFKALYPKATAATMDWAQECGNYDAWMTESTIRIAEYWYVERNVVQGKKRSVVQKTIKFAKINGVEVLEETTWPGKRIPIFPVLGKVMMVDGRPVVSGVIRPQRDAQRLINSYKSRIAEMLTVAPFSPVEGVAGQFENFEHQWSDNNNIYAYREYNPVDVNGAPAPPPKRNVYEPPIAGYSAAVQQEIDDMKATTGIYDASLGAQANEVSGIAIQRRQQQSDNTNMHFMDNLERAFDVSGREMACVIPKVYDTERMVRILGADETAKIVKINAPHQDEKGVTKHYKVGGDDAIEYDVIVTMGRAYSSKRMESYDFMVQLMQSSKTDLLPVLGDVLFANSDTAGADILSARFKKMVPPQLQDQEDGQPQIPPQVQQALQALQQQNQQLTAELHKALDPVEQKSVEMQSRFQIEKLHAETQITIAEIQTKAQNDRERMKWENDLRSQLQLQALDQQHEAAHTVMQAELEHTAADANHQRALDMQAQQPDPQQGEASE